MKKQLCAAALLAATALTACAQEDSKKNTFWIFGPLGLEHQMDSSNSTIGLYLAGLIKDTSDTTEVKLGLAGEYMKYSSPNASGLGYGVRLYSASGFAGGPSIAYVTRPKGQKVAFRFAINAPFGKDVVPANAEIGIGFRF